MDNITKEEKNVVIAALYELQRNHKAQESISSIDIHTSSSTSDPHKCFIRVENSPKLM